MFFPSKIVKIRILFPKEKYQQVISLLGKLGSVQIEDVSENIKEITKELDLSQYSKIEEYYSKLNEFYDLFSKKKYHRKYNSLKYLEKSKVIEKLEELKNEKETLLRELEEKNKEFNLLCSIEDFKEDLSILNNDYITSFVLDRPIKLNLEHELIKLRGRFVLSVKKEDEEKVVNILKNNKVDYWIPKFEGKVKDVIKEKRTEIGNINKRIIAIDRQIDEILNKHGSEMHSIYKYLSNEKNKIEAFSKLRESEYISILEGWIEKKKIEELKTNLDKLTKGAYILEEAKTKEEPPTKLENPILFKVYEFFVRFYSLPKSSEVDPTIFFGILFPIFFGLMIGDAGYGALFLILSILTVKTIDKANNGAIKFLESIVSKNSLKTLLTALIPGSIIAIFLGILFNEYFGFQLPYTPIFNVNKNVFALLMFSGWIGLVVVSFGLVLGIINHIYNERIKKAIGKLGWIIILWGVALLGLALINKSLSIQSSIPEDALLIIGFVLVIFSEGLFSLAELPSIISHFLSYMRLVGILLVSVILAGLIDSIAYPLMHKSIGFAILGGSLLFFGQLFNFFIAIFEAGIQGVRLIYIEFFSKFFEGNGKEFKPFKLED